MRRSTQRLLASALLTLGLPSPAAAIELKPGDLVIRDVGFGSYRIVHVDGVTGDQFVIPLGFNGDTLRIDDDSQILLPSGTSIRSLNPQTGVISTVSSGGLFTATLRGIDLEASGDIIVGMDSAGVGVYRVEPDTGAQEFIGSGAGGVFGVAVAANGHILAAPQLGQEILRYAPDGTLVQTYGLGPSFGRPYDIALRPNGELVIVENVGAL